MDELQIALAVLVLYFSYRYISNRSSSSTAASGSSGSTDRYSGLSARIPPASLEQLQALFPQLGERQLRWEVVRTGRIRSVEVIAQGMLEDQGRGRPLMPPPGSFLPQLVPAAPSPMSGTPNSASTRTATASMVKTPRHESLITRLGLEAEAAEQDAEMRTQTETLDALRQAVSSEAKGKGRENEPIRGWWSMTHQEKKRAMVLDARRRMILKDQAKAETASVNTAL